MIGLEWFDHGSGVEPQDLRQVSAAHSPVFTRRSRLLLQVGKHVLRPVDLHRGNQVRAESRDPIDEVTTPLDRIERAGVRPSGLVDAEIRFSRLKEGVVLRCLDVPLSGVEHPPGGQGLEDGVGRGDVLPHAAACVKEIHARGGEDALVEVRAAAVMADVVRTQVELRNPENLGPCQLRLGHPDARLGGGNDQRSGVGEP